MNTRLVLNQIARKQHGLITLDQALGAGLSTAQVRRRLRSAEWMVVRPKVYAIGGAPPSWVQAVAAVALSARPGAWISHRTAAVLWGLPGANSRAIDVLTGPERRVRLDGVHAHRSGALFSTDLTRRHGIPVTSPARTVVDLSALLPGSQLGALLDDALRARMVTLDALCRCVARLGEAPGRRPAAVRALLAERLPRYNPGESDLETRVLRHLVAAGLPAPVQQHRTRPAGRSLRIDLAYPDLKVAIELDGWEFHRSRTAFDHDRSRANLLVAHGWTVLRFTSRSEVAEIVACVEAARRACGRSGAA